mmetsp:Transcript_56490/g.163826  ORF Transcript_56490/g.163826 Transcript_56490/m.163826 type:complete len:249 (-) Transcript_56490:38-784(-)
MLQHAHLVQHAPQRPNVALEAVWLRLANLWGHVVRRSHNGRGDIHSALENARDAEIADAHIPSFAGTSDEKDVGTFQVAVKDMLLVHVIQRERQLDEPRHDLRLRDEAWRLGARPAFHLATKIATIAEFHDDHKLEILLSHEVVSEGDYVWVPQLPHQLDLLECELVLFLGQKLEADDLGDRLIANTTCDNSGPPCVRRRLPLHQVSGAILPPPQLLLHLPTTSGGNPFFHSWLAHQNRRRGERARPA